MQTFNVRETRERLSNLLDAVSAGEEVIILRHGKPVARLSSPRVDMNHFLDRSGLRDSLPPMTESAVQAVRNLRDEERY